MSNTDTIEATSFEVTKNGRTLTFVETELKGKKPTKPEFVPEGEDWHPFIVEEFKSMDDFIAFAEFAGEKQVLAKAWTTIARPVCIDANRDENSIDSNGAFIPTAFGESIESSLADKRRKGGALALRDELETVQDQFMQLFESLQKESNPEKKQQIELTMLRKMQKASDLKEQIEIKAKQQRERAAKKQAEVEAAA